MLHPLPTDFSAAKKYRLSAKPKGKPSASSGVTIAKSASKAEEIVLVPVQEWKTRWAEPHLALTLRSRVHRNPNSIELLQLDAESEGLTLRSQGRVGEFFSKCSIELNGEANYDLSRVIERMNIMNDYHGIAMSTGGRRSSGAAAGHSTANDRLVGICVADEMWSFSLREMSDHESLAREPFKKSKSFHWDVKSGGKTP